MFLIIIKIVKEGRVLVFLSLGAVTSINCVLAYAISLLSSIL